MLNRVAFTFIAKILTAFLNLAVIVLISRSTGAAGKGEASLVITGIAMILLFSNMVGGTPLIYLLPKYNLFQLLLVSNAWSVLVCLPAWFIFTFFDLLPPGLVIHVILLSLLNSFTATNLTVLLARKQIVLYNIVTLLQTLISFVVLLVILKEPEGIGAGRAYAFSLYVAYIACFILSTAPLLKELTVINLAGAGAVGLELLRMGAVNQAGFVMKFLSVRLSYFLLSKCDSDAELGVFSNGVSLAESLMLITNSFALVQFATIVNSKDKDRSRELTLRLTRITTLLCVAGAACMMILPGSFYTWVFGSGFEGVKRVIYIVAPGIVLYNIALITGHYFSGTGKYYVNTWGNLAGLLAAGIMSVVFYHNYSIDIAGIVSTATYLITTLILLGWYIKETRTSLPAFFPAAGDFKWVREKLRGGKGTGGRAGPPSENTPVSQQ